MFTAATTGGAAAVAAVAALGRRGVRVVTCAAEPTAILDAWAGATLAVVVDAAAGGTRRCGWELSRTLPNQWWSVPMI